MKDFKKFSLLEETETRTSDGTAPILNDLQQIGEFHRVVKNYTKMKKIEAMTNTTQIPASEVERWEREAEELFRIDASLPANPNYVRQADYIAGAKSEYLRREREVQELKDLLDRAKSHLDVSYDSFQSREDLYNEIKKLLRCTI